MTYVTRPTGSPSCWGVQYSDADRECEQCPFKDTCRPTTINRHAGAPVQIRTMTPPTPPPSTMVPLPAKPYLPTAQPVPQPVYRQQPQPPQQVQYAPTQYTPTQYQQQQWHASIPDPNNPSPMVPMARPGAVGPAYFFCQYPGETTAERLGKNMALRGAEAIFGELMFFFRHWTWPPRS